MNKNIIIGFPCSNRAWVLPYFLEHIYKIDYNKKLIDIYCILNNSKDESELILNEFKEKHNHEYNSITIEKYNNSKIPKDERFTHIRNITYNWLSELRNKLFKRCVKMNNTHLFSCDTDILVPSNILNELMIGDNLTCASLIYNGYLHTPNGANKDYNPIINSYKFPNILKWNENKTEFIHIVNHSVANPNLTPKDKIIEVAATGAVCLIPNIICKETYYGWDSQGEDLFWSRRCFEKGYKLYCKPSVYSQHIMNEKLLKTYLDGEMKFKNGEVINIK
jgi:GT2 family glycosyltransferase